MIRIAFWLSALTIAGLSAAAAQTPVERGRYLVETIAACGNCHTPKGPDGPVKGRELAGGFVIEEPPFRAVASNITPDPETGTGRWSDAEIALAIREGRRPDGSLIGPPMPFAFYRGLADADVAAMVAYLRSVPPVHNAVAKSEYRMPLPPNWGPPIGSVTAPPRANAVAYGAYLAGPVGHCLDCHTPMLAGGGRDMGRVGAGGQRFEGPWGVSVAANLTAHKESGLGGWSDQEIERAIRQGIAQSGRPLNPPMGFGYYAAIAPEDMTALIAYLRTLAPLKSD